MTMPSGQVVLDALHKQRVTHVCTVPDWIQIDLHRAIIAEGAQRIRLLPFCTEDEAITAAAGLLAGGARPVVVIQNQGLYAGLNALRAVGLDARMPIILFIGQFGREITAYTQDPAESTRRVVRILQPVLDAIDVPSRNVQRADEIDAVAWAFEDAARRSAPAAVIFGSNLPLEAAI